MSARKVMLQMRVGAALLDVIAKTPLYNRKDLARRYGVSLRTIDQWKKIGKLPKPKYIHGPMWAPFVILKFEEESGGPQ